MIIAINDVLKKAGLDTAISSTLMVGREEMSDQLKLQSRVVELGGDGWLCLTDKILLLPHDAGEMTGKTILSGEIANGEKSLHIRQCASGWELYNMTRSDGGEQLMIEQTFISTKDMNMRLKYEVYWKKNEIGAMTPFASRFAGFSYKGGNN